MSLYLPILLSAFSGVVYQICSKSSPKDLDPLASLTITYVIAAVAAGLMYCIFHKGAGNLPKEYAHLNWTAYILGIAVIGIDLGNRYMYRAGWSVGTGYLVNSVVLSIALLVVGFLIYKETITWNKAIGVVLCLAGVGFISK